MTPNPAYRVARRVARELASELMLTPPFDVDSVAERYVDITDEAIPGRTDVIALHSASPGQHPKIVIQSPMLGSSEARRRFALAHALGHVLLGWHPLGTPCDVTTQPKELPVTAYDLIEGEANAFARELLMPSAWIESFDAFDRPAELIRHVSERAGVPVMPAARAVASLLEPGYVFVVSDEWGGIIDAGRSPGTMIKTPRLDDNFDSSEYAHNATDRHRADLDNCTLIVWHFDDKAAAQLPHDRTARDIAQQIGAQLGLDSDHITELVARVDGVAGWANEQLGVASLDGMTKLLDQRVRDLPEMNDVVTHPEYQNLVDAKAVELVSRRLVR